MKTSAYETVKLARSNDRPTSISYIRHIFHGYLPFAGDRRFGEDQAVTGGIAWFGEIPCTVIGLEKGIGTKDRIRTNFGSAHPEGYRKALRLMKQAEKFHRPVICFVDTSGAYAGIGAEERGQGQAIAENLMEMMTLKTPVLSILIGEGGSGGALALAVADQVWMMEDSVYSVISPEGCASILWKDTTKTAWAAECLKLTADDLLSLGIIEKIIPFGTGLSAKADSVLSTDRRPAVGEDSMDQEEDVKFGPSVFLPLQKEICRFLERQMTLSSEQLIQERYSRFRKIGC